MAPNPIRGWLPVEIAFDRRPAVVREAMVRWMEFGSTPLAEPFFDSTVARLRSAEPPAREIETDLDTMIRVSSRLSAIRPAGFIFHVSHCGSTLISNALKTSNRVLMVSEPAPLTNYFLRPLSPANGTYLNQAWSRTRRELLNALFGLFAHYRLGEPEPLVIKFSSLNILSIVWVRSCWPDVPCVIVIRDPVEVMVACQSGAGWMSFKKFPQVSREMFGWSDLPRSAEEMTDEEFCARVLGRFFESALDAVGLEANDVDQTNHLDQTNRLDQTNHLDQTNRLDQTKDVTQAFISDKCMVVDYADVTPDRIRDIAAFLAIDLPGQGENLELVFRSNAKDPKMAARFQDDRARKQKLAGVLVRSAGSLWAADAYAKLRTLARRREAL